LSLKDRLKTNTNSKTTNIIGIQEETLEYYETNEIDENSIEFDIIDTLLADDELNSIQIYGAKNIYIEKKGKISRISANYRDNIHLENIVRKYAKKFLKDYDELSSFYNFNYSKGVNISAILPPLSSVPVVYVKNFKNKFATLQNLQENQSISKEIALFLDAIMPLNLNIIIAGEKNTLKTTLLTSLIKQTQLNNRCILIDYKNEIENNMQSIANYNFLELNNNKKLKNEIIEQIISLNPERLFINNIKEEDFNIFFNYLKDGFKGFITTINSKSPIDALEKLTNIYKNKENITYEASKDLIYNNIDIIIFIEKNGSQQRKVSSISIVKNDKTLDGIFYLNENNEHISSGVMPEFFENIEKSSLPISVNIFDSEYKHTYYQTQKNENLVDFNKKNLNPEILKKFKKALSKDFQTTEIKQENQNTELNENQDEQN